jgi:hypothetical protein
MKKPRKLRQANIKLFGIIGLALVFLLFILLYKLGSLNKGISLGEVSAAHLSVGWHGIYNDPLNMPLKLLRSIDYFLFKTHGQSLTRLPNVIVGLISILSFSYLVYLWHGVRNAVFASLLFATSAWTLHTSRLASYDVDYYLAILWIFLSYALLKQKEISLKAWYFCLFAWGIILTIPGCIWLVLIMLVRQRELIVKNFKEVSQTIVQKVIAIVLSFIWLPLIVIDLLRPIQAKLWLGLPAHFASVTRLLKQFVAVPAHIFIRGPQYPQLWLGKAPLLDGFSLVMALIGIYFYVKHWQSNRAMMLAGLFVVCWILIALGGPVSFSLIVPFAFFTYG